ncbi:hypothetical protein ABW99_16795 [Pandoraea thiooxydans]|uniref:Uncharacterized protein n=1 Tax=Pandoraea thiooxydans TaxID=445709 RepID=A0A0G3EUB9_9BURK|nr:hypothetical protein ABW99_16795 [Pandoraea thiooxydans]
MLTHVIKHGLPDHDSCFNRFAETDLVSQKITLGMVGQDSAYDINLMRFEFNRRRKQRGNAESIASLIEVISEKSGARFGILRRLGNEPAEVDYWVLNGALPSNEDLAILKIYVVLVG